MCHAVDQWLILWTTPETNIVCSTGKSAPTNVGNRKPCLIYSNDYLLTFCVMYQYLFASSLAQQVTVALLDYGPFSSIVNWINMKFELHTLTASAAHQREGGRLSAITRKFDL